ncbi:MAG: rhomboid family intramembrane serine protease [Thermoprotei archaeon]|nr:MAG: rhomboid family intramembrane serine protease [Thermoprotei archaeon]RLF18260.1 MAG: rhomboid family intramembrane serine protease [Thermoprotei archaeon]
MAGIPVGTEGTRRRMPIITITIIAINVAIFLITYSQGPFAFEAIIEKYGLIPAKILRGEALYTLITSMFLHGGLMHLIGNMLYLYVFGPGVELRLGRSRFLLLYLLSGIVASFAHTFIVVFFAQPYILFRKIVHPALIPCVGASGAISGVLGAYMILMPYRMVNILTIAWPGIPIVIRLPAAIFIGLWFLYQLFMGMVSLALPYPFFSGVAFWAHIGGFIAGIILPRLIGRHTTRRRIYIDYMGRVWYEIPIK